MNERTSNPEPQTPVADAERPALPPDPAAYDSPRASAARARGLAAPYIAGGRDPQPDEGHREERFYGRILVAMILVIVLGGFVLGIVSVLLNLGA
ncbi:MAG TPA: hypothetical protein VGC90_04720 [Candidatus Limnocylindrales bacterium]